MTSAAAETASPVVTWGWAGFALEGTSGDLHVVVEFPRGALVAVLDGLGHGPEAAAASEAARVVLHEHPQDDVLALIHRCHEALRKTRGAVMSLASFSARDSTMTWAGVGNVEGTLLRARASKPAARHQALTSRGGVVGFQLPPLRADTVVLQPGDTVVFTTDGIESRFSAEVFADETPKVMAESILNRFLKQTDDAHVLVARSLGGATP